MVTPIFCCGGECGQIGTVGQHFSAGAGTPTIETTTVRSGARAFRCTTSGSNVYIKTIALASATRWIGRFYIRFVGSLPNLSTNICGFSAVSGPAVRFNQADSKIYARVFSTDGATGVTVAADQWIRIDFDFNISTGGNDTCDVQVDGTACGQATAAGAAAGDTQLIIGLTSGGTTSDVIIDDIVLSQTAADYPFGAGNVYHFIPTSDGTHNIAGTGDFQRTLTGTDILNATTTAFQLVDDVPLESGASVDWINMLAPPNATDYVECVFGPASGISTPIIAPRAVEVIAAIHQAGTGTGNMEIRIKDNATQNAMYSATTVAGVTSIAYKRKHYATAIAGGGAWVVGGGGNGDFNNLKVRFGSPAALDVNPDQYFDCIMIEAEFAVDSALTQSPNDDINLLADARGLGYGNLHTDTLQALTDTAQVVLGLSLILSDTANNLADGLTKVIGVVATAADSLQALTDALVKLMSYELALADSEAANWADTHQLLLAYFLALADSYTISDATTLQLEHRTTFTDSYTLSDSVVVVLGYKVLLADVLDPLTDSITLNLGYSLSASDTLPARLDYATACLYVLGIEIECVDSEAHIGLEFYDDADNLTDAYAQTLHEISNAIELDLSDTIILSDSLAIGYGLLTTDTITLTDDQSVELGQLVTFSDSLTLDDFALINEGHLFGLDDSFILLDSQSTVLGYNEPLADSFTLTDGESNQLGQLLEFADSVDNLSDTHVLLLGHLLTFTESLTLTDSAAFLLVHLLNLNDDTNFIADFVQTDAPQGPQVQVGITDALAALSDSIQLRLGYQLALNDNAANWADSIAFTYGFSLILDDNAQALTDDLASLLHHRLQLGDSFTLTDALTTFGENYLTVTDAFVLSDDVDIELRGPDFNFALVDALNFNDTIALSLGVELQLQVVISDAITLVDHYFDIRYPYASSAKRHVVVPSRSRGTVVNRQRVTRVPTSNRTISRE